MLLGSISICQMVSSFRSYRAFRNHPHFLSCKRYKQEIIKEQTAKLKKKVYWIYETCTKHFEKFEVIEPPKNVITQSKPKQRQTYLTGNKKWLIIYFSILGANSWRCSWKTGALNLLVKSLKRFLWMSSSCKADTKN